MSRPKQSKGSTDFAKGDLVTNVTGVSDSMTHGACSPGKNLALRSRSGNSGSANSQSLPALLHLALQHISQPNHDGTSGASSSMNEKGNQSPAYHVGFPPSQRTRRFRHVRQPVLLRVWGRRVLVVVLISNDLRVWIELATADENDRRLRRFS